MKLGSTRTLEGLGPVLKDPDSQGPDPVYWVFSEVSENSWANITIIASGKMGEEYPKTFGHYHGSNVLEKYHLIEGGGILLLQKKFFEGGNWIENRVEEVILVEAKPGDEVVISAEWGHSWSNIGDLPLISFDDWRAGHTPSDYSVIEELRGMAYYLVSENGKPTPIANSNYRDLPKPQWMSAKEFSSKFG